MVTVTITATATLTQRAMDRVLSASRILEGEGFEVRCAVPAAGLPAVGRFISLIFRHGDLRHERGERRAEGAVSLTRTALHTMQAGL